MPESESVRRNQMQSYRPACSKCGALTMLEYIEPADEPGHELRTFECTTAAVAKSSRCASGKPPSGDLSLSLVSDYVPRNG